MEQLAEQVGLQSKEYKGKSKLAMSKVVHAKGEDQLEETGNKVEYLTGSRRHSKKLIQTKRPKKNR